MLNLPPTIPKTTEELSAFLTSIDNQALPASTLARVKNEFSPLIAELNNETAKTSKAITGSRFWLGEALHERYRRHYDALTRLASDFDLAKPDLRGIKQRIAELEATCEDVVALSDRLSPIKELEIKSR
jgi:hypothetical protein